MMRELTLKEMETVSAGTIRELDEIISALVKNGIFRTAITAVSHIPGLNQREIQCVVSSLAKFGIKAEIDLGFAGTGLGSSANRYFSIANGKAMNHQEVLSAIGSQLVP